MSHKEFGRLGANRKRLHFGLEQIALKCTNVALRGVLEIGDNGQVICMVILVINGHL